jgi:4-aminobutyrate--pyruvate transaminase
MTPPRNSNATRDIANVLHPYTDHRAHAKNGPLVITRGEGVRVFDDQGKEYIEAVAGLWCASLGFSNARLVEAAHAQMLKLPFYHAFTAKSHEPLIDLSEMLIERSPVATVRKRVTAGTRGSWRPRGTGWSTTPSAGGRPRTSAA